jgi:hypothetical protein
MMLRTHLPAALTFLASVFSACASLRGGAGEPDEASAGVQDSLQKAFDAVVASSQKHDGLFTLYQDTLTGSLHMTIAREQVGREFIYFIHTVDGVPAAGHFRGDFRDYRIFSIRKTFNRIELVFENPVFYFDPASPLSGASEANMSPSIVAVQNITGLDGSTGAYLIQADSIFLTESFHQIKRTPDPEAEPGTVFTLGDLNPAKTRYAEIHDYPLNTDVVVEYVFDNPYPPGDPWDPASPIRGGREVTDPRFVSIRMQHSLIAVPDNDYRPRLDDPRIGYFTEIKNDMTSTSATPYRDFINRWHLVKKDPAAEVSEPVEPITWWIENTTPLEYRATIRDAALTWNRAFEEAGFRDAIRVQVQPDDADWDAGDIRYNVIRWASSPSPQFWGYGPSFTNPRTGQILGADIMLEWISVTYSLHQEKIFETAGLYLNGESRNRDPRACSLGLHLHRSSLFGVQSLRAQGAGEDEVSEFMKSMLHYLVLHEIGHTLGLTHNMKSSQMLSPAALEDSSVTSSRGLTGSVMEYTAVNVAAPGHTQGEYHTTTPGPYDLWAIEYGYSTALPNDEAEEQRLERLLARSTASELAFGNDADDMSFPGHGIDPRVMVFDMSSDPIGYAIGRFELIDELMAKLPDLYQTPGESYHELRNAFLILTAELGDAANVVARYPGGIHLDRAMIDQEGATQPLMPVPREEQERAMEVLETYVFAPGAFEVQKDLYARLQIQRRGFEHYWVTEDPKIHERVLNIQMGVLDQLLHPVVLKRVSDTRLYGNEYPLTELMADMTAAVFDADRRGDVNTFRQNLQTEYVTRLGRMVREEEAAEYDHLSRSAAHANLLEIRETLRGSRVGNGETRAHRTRLLFLIERALDPRAAGGVPER